MRAWMWLKRVAWWLDGIVGMETPLSLAAEVD